MRLPQGLLLSIGVVAVASLWGFFIASQAAIPARLVLPDDPDLWICINTKSGRSCLMQPVVRDWMLENAPMDYQP